MNYDVETVARSEYIMHAANDDEIYTVRDDRLRYECVRTANHARTTITRQPLYENSPNTSRVLLVRSLRNSTSSILAIVSFRTLLQLNDGFRIL